MRISVLESHFAALNKSVDALDRKMGANQQELVAQMSEITGQIAAKIDQVREKASTSGRTNWPVLLTAAGLIISVMSALLVYTTRPIEIVNTFQSERIAGLESDARAVRDAILKDHDLLIRLDERLRMAAGTVGALTSPSTPSLRGTP